MIGARTSKVAAFGLLVAFCILALGTVGLQSQTTAETRREWQASADFSASQGQNDWYYQEWTGSTYQDMRFDAANNRWQGSQMYCILGPDWAHLDGACEPARKWVSSASGTVRITGNVHDQQPENGDGVVVTILKGSTELWSRTIANGDAKGYDLDLQVAVQAGDAIYFRVNRRGDSGWDGTYFNPAIQLLEPAVQATGQPGPAQGVMESSSSGNAQLSFTLGPREDLLALGTFGLGCFPDEHLGVLKIAGQYHAWFAGGRYDIGNGTFHMTGQTLESMEVELDAAGKAKPVLRAGGWHARTDFSSIQGQGDWCYQEWAGSSYRDMRFDSKDNTWHGSKELCLIGPDWTHPDSGREPARKWVSPVAATVTIVGNAHDTGPNCGDGVVVRILKGGTELWSKTIANGDTKGYDFNLQVPVQVGDAICFRVSMRDDPGCDSTYFNPSISLEGTFDNGYAGFGSVYLDKASGEILAFYHAEDHEGVATTTGAPGYYASVGLAISRDGGRTFQKMGQVLTSGKPKSPSSPDGAQGVGGPAVIVDPSGQYLYMYFMDWTRDAPWGDIGVARSRIEDGGRPGTWFKYYNGDFTEPGLGGRATLIVGRSVPGDWAAFPSVSFNSYLSQYLMVYAARDGFYLKTSGDGIAWSLPTQLLTSATGFVGSPVSLYPTIIGEDDTHTGQENWLYYGFTPKALTEECHHMVRQRISFSH